MKVEGLSLERERMKREDGEGGKSKGWPGTQFHIYRES
jgi:hypothetical protein